MSIWLVRLSGSGFDLHLLNSHLRTPECITRDGHNNEFYLESSSFDIFDDVDPVVSRGQELIQRLNGVGQLLNLVSQPISFGGDVMRNNNDGRQIQYILPPLATARVGASIPHISGITPLERSPAETLMMEAEECPAVARAIRLFGQDHTWDNLYKVLDAIREAVGGESKLRARDWVAAGELKRFTQTANSVQAVGDAARHGHTKTPSPQIPMPLSHATELIRTLLTKLIQSRTGPSL